MKKLLLLLLVSNLGLAQQSSVQIKLVNPNIGTYNNGGGNNSTCFCGPSSNDIGLNVIFQNHNVIYMYSGSSHPDYPGIEREKILLVDCINCDLDQLVADLNAYASVIDQANKCPTLGAFSDVAYIKLIDNTITLSNSGNTVTTNDSALNQIFTNRNVFFLNGVIGSWTGVTCDCNVQDLIDDLIANNFILPNTITVVSPGVFYSNYDNYSFARNVVLNLGESTKPKAVIAPNPFSEYFNIETEQNITNYAIVDITGKILLSTSSKADLDNQSSQLGAGMYLLNLDFDNGQKANYKLVKK